MNYCREEHDHEQQCPFSITALDCKLSLHGLDRAKELATVGDFERAHHAYLLALDPLIAYLRGGLSSAETGTIDRRRVMAAVKNALSDAENVKVKLQQQKNSKISKQQEDRRRNALTDAENVRIKHQSRENSKITKLLNDPRRYTTSKQQQDLRRSALTDAENIRVKHQLQENGKITKHQKDPRRHPKSNQPPSFSSLLSLGSRPTSKFMTVDDVPKEYFKEHRHIYAFCERVIDGDTIRVRHLPDFSTSWWRRMLEGSNKASVKPLQKRALSDCTLSIRIYGVDCPELSKSKKQQSQPFAEEAKQFATDMVLHSVVKIIFLRKDQYRRAIAVVELVQDWGYKNRRKADLANELAKAGLAELYVLGGAEYYNRRELLERSIATAKRRKLGIWSLDKRESAAEYKLRLKNNLTHAITGLDNTKCRPSRRGSDNDKSFREDYVLVDVTTGLENITI